MNSESIERQSPETGLLDEGNIDELVEVGQQSHDARQA